MAKDDTFDNPVPQRNLNNASRGSLHPCRYAVVQTLFDICVFTENDDTGYLHAHPSPISAIIAYCLLLVISYPPNFSLPCQHTYAVFPAENML